MSKVTITIEFDDGAQVSATVGGENITHNLQAAIQSVTVAANTRHGVTAMPDGEMQHDAPGPDGTTGEREAAASG